MSKSTISITLDSDVISLLDGYTNKSQIINNILKRALTTEEGISEQVSYHQSQIKALTEELKQHRVNISNMIESIPEGLKIELKKIKGILERSPDKLYIWTRVINSKYKLNFNPEQIKILVEKWG